MYGNGVIIYGSLHHLPVALIQLALVQAFTVSYAAAAGSMVPISAGLLTVTTTTRPTPTAASVFVL